MYYSLPRQENYLLEQRYEFVNTGYITWKKVAAEQQKITDNAADPLTI